MIAVLWPFSILVLGCGSVVLEFLGGVYLGNCKNLREVISKFREWMIFVNSRSERLENNVTLRFGKIITKLLYYM